MVHEPPAPRAQRIRALIADCTSIGALPAAYHKLSQVVRDPNANADKIAAAVRLDPALTARLLQLVNSAALRPSHPIETVSQAAMRIGMNQLQQLALATTVVRMFRGLPEHLLDMTSFWTHSVAVGVAAHILGRSLGERRTESLFVAGMLHDVGTLMLCTAQPKEMRNVLIETENSGRPALEVEFELLGFTHAEVGAMLLQSWGLSQRVVDVARWHHEPSTSPPPHRPMIDIVHIGDVLASALSMGNGGERAAHALDAEAWQRTGLSTGDLRGVISEFDAQVSSVVESLLA